MKDRAEVRLSSGDTGFLNKGCPWTGINEYCIESPLGSLTHYDRKQVTVVPTEDPIKLGDWVQGKSYYTFARFTGILIDESYRDRVTIELATGQHGCVPGQAVLLEKKSLVKIGAPKDTGLLVNGIPWTKPKVKMTSRQEVIDEASKLIHSDRNASYGEPTQNFKDTAALWNTQFGHKLKEPLTSTDVAQAMILLKMARMKASPKKDNWADAIGYAACGFECDVSEGRISE
jgi:hypothetical protein